MQHICTVYLIKCRNAYSAENILAGCLSTSTVLSILPSSVCVYTGLMCIHTHTHTSTSHFQLKNCIYVCFMRSTVTFILFWLSMYWVVKMRILCAFTTFYCIPLNCAYFSRNFSDSFLATIKAKGRGIKEVEKLDKHIINTHTHIQTSHFLLLLNEIYFIICSASLE